MAKESSKIRVFSGGGLSVAPFGTTLPTSPIASLDPAFTDLGYLTEDGATFTKGQEVEDIRSWQSATPTRRVVTTRSYGVAGQLQQQDQVNYALAFGGGDWTEPTLGIFRYDPPADTDDLPEYSLVVDGVDGDIHHRAVIIRATIEGETETQWVRNAAALLPLNFAALTPDGADAPWYYLTDDENFAEAS